MHKGPGGHNQWRPVLKPGDTRKSAPKIMMLTADVALLEDPSYLKLVKLYAANQTALDVAFRDGEWVLLIGGFGMGYIRTLAGCFVECDVHGNVGSLGLYAITTTPCFT